MDILTVNVGQGSLAVVRHNGEAIIIDARIPPAGDDTVAYVKGTLSTYLKDHSVRGLILTGFDSDHSNTTGIGLILMKYRPDWVMYPKYYKDTDQATSVFQIIDREEKNRAGSARSLIRHSVRLDNIKERVLKGLSPYFEFELFSPHIEDMDNSNNSSIVLRLRGKGPGGFSYLVTGDTENERWEKINSFFGNSLRSDTMAAAHHGSKNGANARMLYLVEPNTILVSAGVDNQYGHPDPQAVKAFSRIAKHVYSTHVNGGVSLMTSPAGPGDFSTNLIR